MSAKCLKFIRGITDTEINIDAEKTTPILDQLFLDAATLFRLDPRIVVESYKVKTLVPGQDTHVDERSVVRGVAIMPGRDVHRQERTTNRINHTHSLASHPSLPGRWSQPRSIFAEENCLLSYRENRKTLDLGTRTSDVLSSSTPRGIGRGMEWRRGDWRKWGKNVPPERNCQAWMSAMGGNRFLKNTRVRNCLQKFKTREKRYRAWEKFRELFREKNVSLLRAEKKIIKMILKIFIRKIIDYLSKLIKN